MSETVCRVTQLPQNLRPVPKPQGMAGVPQNAAKRGVSAVTSASPIELHQLTATQLQACSKEGDKLASELGNAAKSPRFRSWADEAEALVTLRKSTFRSVASSTIRITCHPDLVGPGAGLPIWDSP